MKNKYTLTPYGEGAFILKKLNPNEFEYRMLGCDYPTKTEKVWRFWIECGFESGEAKTLEAHLTETEKEEIKKLVIKELNRNK